MQVDQIAAAASRIDRRAIGLPHIQVMVGEVRASGWAASLADGFQLLMSRALDEWLTVEHRRLVSTAVARRQPLPPV